MLWDQAEKIIKSIMKNNFYILIILLMILLSSLISPTSTRIAFENLGKILPELLANYFKNLSMTNKQIFSIFQLLSTLHIFSLCILFLSAWKMNYFEEAKAIFGFFLTINTYFILFLSILYRLDVTTFSFTSTLEILEQTAGFKILFLLVSFSLSWLLSWLYIVIILIGFIKHKDL